MSRSSYKHTLNTVVSERLQADGVLATFDVALMRKGLELLRGVERIEDWEVLTRGRKNITPVMGQQAPQTTVNVHQGQEQNAIRPLSPRDALADLVRRSLAASEENSD